MRNLFLTNDGVVSILACAAKTADIIKTLEERMTTAYSVGNKDHIPPGFVGRVCLSLSDHIDSCAVATGIDKDGYVSVNTHILETEVIRPLVSIYLENNVTLAQAMLGGWGVHMCVEILRQYKRDVQYINSNGDQAPIYSKQPRIMLVKW